VFTVRFRPDPSCSDPIKSLRWLLKKAKRLGLVAVDAVEEGDAHPGSENKSANEAENQTNIRKADYEYRR
jgi:hypothetical protein